MAVTEVPDVIVVGSGPAGATVAQTAIEAGASVLMLDVGKTDQRYAGSIPEMDYLTLRRSDPDQHRYLLGDLAETLPGTGVATGAQLTPPRRFVIEAVERYLPLASIDFAPTESLALGGLGSAWGLGCCVFSDSELVRAGLDRQRMRAAYQVVADRIGISGSDDDAAGYTAATLRGLMPSHALDENGEALSRAYRRKQARLRSGGFVVGRPSLALMTEDRDDRRQLSYDDLDFYTDRDRSAYRPWITIEALRGNPRFTYRPDRLVTRFREIEGQVEVDALDTSGGDRTMTYRGRTVVLAAGALGSGRIALRSHGTDSSVPVLSNPYTYMPCLQPRLLGAAMRKPRTAFAQLAVFHDPDGRGEDVAMGSVYSYRSLMLFRLLPQAPVAMADAIPLLRFLSPAITIIGIHHPEGPAPGKQMRLEPDSDSPTGDRLRVDYPLDADVRKRIDAREGRFRWAMRQLGALPIKRIRPPIGASIHYAGTLPFSQEAVPLHLDPSGRLHGTHRVYVADSSGFGYLPAKGLTLSIMANAHDVARTAVRGV